MTNATPGSDRVAASRCASREATALLRLVATGDPLAFDDLYRRLAAPSLGLAQRIVVDHHLARDVVQESFVDVWTNSRRYDSVRGSATSWVLTIVHHKAVDCVRREQRLRQRQSSYELLADIESTLPLSDDLAVRDDEHGAMRRMLKSLPMGQRQALVLAYFGGYTYAEVAVHLDVPLSTVKSRCRTGMSRLRSKLSAAGYGDGSEQ